MRPLDKRRELLKEILLGRVSAKEARAELQGPDIEDGIDYSLLTDTERPRLLDYHQRWESYQQEIKGVEWVKQGAILTRSFTVLDLLLLNLLRSKAIPHHNKRYLLERVDLTTLSQDDASNAHSIVSGRNVKYYDLPDWLQE